MFTKRKHIVRHSSIFFCSFEGIGLAHGKSYKKKMWRTRHLHKHRLFNFIENSIRSLTSSFDKFRAAPKYMKFVGQSKNICMKHTHVQIYIYMYICISMYTCIFIHIHLHSYFWRRYMYICTRTCACTYAYTYTVYTHAQIHTHINTYMRTHASILIHICTRKHAYIYAA